VQFSDTAVFIDPPISVAIGDHIIGINKLFQILPNDQIYVRVSVSGPQFESLDPSRFGPVAVVSDYDRNTTDYNGNVPPVNWPGPFIAATPGNSCTFDGTVTDANFDNNLPGLGAPYFLGAQPPGQWEVMERIENASHNLPYVIRIDYIIVNDARTSAPPPPKHFTPEAKSKLQSDANSISKLSNGLSALSSATDPTHPDSKLANTLSSQAASAIDSQIGKANSLAQTAISTVANAFDRGSSGVNPIGVTLSVAGAITSLGGKVVKVLANDPPDANYTEVFQMPDWSFGAIPGASAAANKFVMDSWTLLQDATNALAASERYQGAELAGDAPSQNLQDAAFNTAFGAYVSQKQVFTADIQALLPEVEKSISDVNLAADTSLAAAQSYVAGLANPLTDDPFISGFISTIRSNAPYLSADIDSDMQQALAAFAAQAPAGLTGSAFGLLSQSAADLDPGVLWGSGVSGDFAAASNWNKASVPGVSDAAQISPSGTYTVTSTANETVNSLTTAAGATLFIGSGIFTINKGTGSGANAGTILVGAGATLVLNGSVSNTGLLEALGGNLTINGGPVTGAGSVKVGSGGSVNATGNSYVFHGAGGSELVLGTGNTNSAFSDSGSALLAFTGNQNQLFGGTMSDWLGVTGNNNALVGGSGNDFIGATGSTNTLAGGSGNPTLFANGSSNFMYAGTGQDWLGASGNQNQLFGGPGADWMGVTGNNNAIAGGSGNSTLFAVGSLNTLSGGKGNDWIGASGTSNFLFGGSGNDFIGATGSSNTLDPHGAGTDTLFAAANAHDHDTFVYHPGYGNVTIDNFTPQAVDQIAIAGFGFTHVTQFAPYVTTTADGSIALAFSASSRLTLEGIKGGLQDSWFNFHA